jgi:hypothetical protein
MQKKIMCVLKIISIFIFKSFVKYTLLVVDNLGKIHDLQYQVFHWHLSRLELWMAWLHLKIIIIIFKKLKIYNS